MHDLKMKTVDPTRSRVTPTDENTISLAYVGTNENRSFQMESNVAWFTHPYRHVDVVKDKRKVSSKRMKWEMDMTTFTDVEIRDTTCCKQKYVSARWNFSFWTS